MIKINLANIDFRENYTIAAERERAKVFFNPVPARIRHPVYRIPVTFPVWIHSITHSIIIMEFHESNQAEAKTEPYDKTRSIGIWVGHVWLLLNLDRISLRNYAWFGGTKICFSPNLEISFSSK